MTMKKFLKLFEQEAPAAPATSFKDAFAAGRKAALAGGSKTFQWTDPKTGKLGTYGTDLKKPAAPTPVTPASSAGPQAQAPTISDRAATDSAVAGKAPAPAPAPAPAASAPAVDPSVASGQNIGGQFAKAASDKAAQDSFAQLSGMAPKVAPAPAAPAEPAPAASAAPAPIADFSKPTMTTGNQAAASSTPTKTYGGGYDPTKVQYAVDQPKDDPQAVKGGFGQPTNIRTDTTDDIAKRGPFGIPKNEDIEESLEEELEEAFNDMLRLSGIQLNEKAVSKQQQKFMGMVHAMQKGEKVKGASKELKKAAKGMSKKDAKDFASTKHKGLPQKISENVVLEAGNNLEHIVTRFKHETKNFLAGHELDSDLYEALYDYYADAGEMPYGVAKARDGDPFEWVSQHFEDDLAMMGHQRVFQETVMPVMDDTLSELARLAGLHESRVDECGDMGMGQEDSMNISTNMSSDGNKTVTISAQGGDAEALIQMLKLAGMGHMGHDSETEEPVVMVSGDDEMMDEAKQKRMTKYSNTPDEEYETVHAITRQGNDLNREKRQYAGKPKLGDNPMAEEVALDEELQSLLDSVLVREEEPTWLQKQPSKSQDEIAADWEARVKADKGGVLPAERGGIRGATNPPPDSQYPPGDKRNMMPRRK